MHSDERVIIAIAGAAGAGKDSTAKFVMHNQPAFVQYEFARPIKKYVNAMFGWDERHANGPLKNIVDPAWGFSPRHAYQTFGTDWGRNLLRDDIWMLFAHNFLVEHNYVVISDLRFDNEWQFLERYGFNGNVDINLIRVERESEKIALSGHASENGLKDVQYDLVIPNNGSLDALNDRVALYMKKQGLI